MGKNNRFTVITWLASNLVLNISLILSSIFHYTHAIDDDDFQKHKKNVGWRDYFAILLGTAAFFALVFLIPGAIRLYKLCIEAHDLHKQLKKEKELPKGLG